jgi:hypothetical protein
MAFYGTSFITGYTGEILKQMGRGEEGESEVRREEVCRVICVISGPFDPV